MNAIASFGLCTLTDAELLEKVDKATDAMYQTGRIPDRQIPARPNEDYDLLVGELLRRYYRGNNFISIYNEWANFSNTMFADATPEVAIKKLEEQELVELKEEIKNRNCIVNQEQVEQMIDEYADCFLCLMQAADKMGVSATQLVERIGNKVNINKSRKWRKKEDGTYQHIKE